MANSIKNKQYFFKHPGAHTELKLKNSEFPELEPDSVIVKNTFIGINHTDILIRKGIIRYGNNPGYIGIEGAGIIESLSPNAEKKFAIGQKVLYCTKTIGSYSNYVTVPSKAIIGIPEDIDISKALALAYRGLMSHVLTYNVYNPLKSNNLYIYVNGASGGVGHILIQLLLYMKVKVIAGVGSNNKIKTVQNLGCKHVLNYNDPKFVEKVKTITKREGVIAIYDCIGASAFKTNLNILSFLGVLINYGDVSGIPTSFDFTFFKKKSIFFTRPDLNIYRHNRMELLLSMELLFKLLRNNIINPIINYGNFKDIPTIHKKMEARESLGVNIIKL